MDERLANRKFSRVVGNTYGRWKVIDDLIYWEKGSKRYVLCECNCDDKTLRMVNLYDLTSGGSKSCGCYNSDVSRERATKHGFSKHPLYNVWTLIKKRCYNSNDAYYKDYGNRGITVCDKWKDNPREFINWALDNGYKKGLQIDRIDNDGNYEPTNCRFVTPQENVLNMRLIQANNKTGYRGVYNKDNKYCSGVTYNKKRHYLGLFKTAKEAAIARDTFIVENDFPHKLNFPELRKEHIQPELRYWSAL